MFLSRGDRDLGVAFQTHPGRQAFLSSGSKEPRSALESRRVSLGAHWVGISSNLSIFWEILMVQNCPQSIFFSVSLYLPPYSTLLSSLPELSHVYLLLNWPISVKCRQRNDIEPDFPLLSRLHFVSTLLKILIKTH